MNRILLLVLCALLVAPAHAHKPSDSYLGMDIQNRNLQVHWDIALRDLDYAIGLDGNDDGAVSWGEVRHQRDVIAAYALARLRITADRQSCAAQPVQLLIDRHSDGAYAVLRFTLRCPTTPRALDVDYRLFADLDPMHRGLLRIEYAGMTHSAILGPAQARQHFTLTESNRVRQFIDYARAGIWHIWTGYDHILFLITLLLPAVLQRRDGGWRAVADGREALADIVKTVTAFTLAHSITLSLATLGIVTLPARLTESAIAASVVLAAINNLYPLFHRRRWLVAFSFGLLHGFGFAAVLTDLGLAPGALALSLAAFNLGVEGGQLAIVCAAMPLALWLRDSNVYRRVVLTAGSATIAMIAFVWLLQRSLDLRLIPG